MVRARVQMGEEMLIIILLVLILLAILFPKGMRLLLFALVLFVVYALSGPVNHEPQEHPRVEQQ